MVGFFFFFSISLPIECHYRLLDGRRVTLLDPPCCNTRTSVSEKCMWECSKTSLLSAKKIIIETRGKVLKLMKLLSNNAHLSHFRQFLPLFFCLSFFVFLYFDALATHDYSLITLGSVKQVLNPVTHTHPRTHSQW